MSDGHLVREAAGTISITPGALTSIVHRAAESVEGTRVRRRRRGLEIAVADGTARVELSLAAPYGAILPDLARAVQERVADTLAAMCEVRVEAVDVTVDELTGA
jgi:uncharacterized alkaline shock family protein YloU